jgi:hypothetical protein
MFNGFQKKFCIVFSISLTIFLTAGRTAIAETWDVYPTMTRLAIQDVVDSASDGDTIYFQPGDYDWTDAPVIFKGYSEGAITIIEKSLIIKGENGTLIFGPDSIDGTGDNAYGANAFHVIDLDIDNDVTFDNLNFQNFLRGIAVAYSTLLPEGYIAEPNARNIAVKNCTFTDIHRDAISLSNVRGDILIQNNEMSAERVGMFIDWVWSRDNDWQAEDSHVRILGNKIDSVTRGIYLSMSTNVAIKRNEIDCSGIGIHNFRTRKGTVIAENSFFNCYSGVRINGSWSLGVKYEAEEAVIEKNELFDMRMYGIVLVGNACSNHTVSKNDIRMLLGSFAGIFTRSSSDYFGQNKITGSGSYAFYLRGGPYYWAHHEILQANNVNKFTPDNCHFYLGYPTHDNLIVGSGMGHNTYVDYGYYNRITGAMPMTGGIGQDLSEAIKERNEELQEARKIKF